MGRKKLPDQIVKMRGTVRKDRERTPAVQGEKLETVRQCAHTGLDIMTPRARQIFRAKCRDLIALRILERQHLDELYLYAVELDEYLTASEEIAKNGRYITVRNEIGAVSRIIENPAFRIKDRALKNVVAIGSNFGFSPVDQLKIKGVTDVLQDEDEFTEFELL